MNCLVIYMYRGNKYTALVQETNERDWYYKFKSQHGCDNVISHMFVS